MQYLNFIGDVFKIKEAQRKKIVEQYAKKFELYQDLNNLISSYSHGMKQKLAIISAFIHSPKLLILDEPFVGLDPKAAFIVKKAMIEFCKNGGAIFFSTHVLEIAEKLWPMPIKSMFGVGKKTLTTLLTMGIKTIGELANYDNVDLLKEIIGETNALSLYSHANGIGSNEVDINRFNDVSSISNSQTFDHDEYDLSNMKLIIKLLTNTMCHRMEKHSLKAYNFTLQLKYNNFKVTSKSITIMNPTSDSRRIYKMFENLFEEFYDDAFPLRLIGVSAGKLIEANDEIKQLSIFDSLDEEQKDHEIDNLIKSINSDLGGLALKRGVSSSEHHNIRVDKFDKSWRDKK